MTSNTSSTTRVEPNPDGFTIQTDPDGFTLVYHRFPVADYGKVVRFKERKDTVDYVKGFKLVKDNAAEINRQYGGTRNNEDAARLLWTAWLDGPVNDFVSRFGVALVPQDIRSAINNVELHTTGIITNFGPDEGVLDDDDFAAYIRQHFAAYMGQHARIVFES